MLRNTHLFWKAYKKLLKLRGKKKSDVKELHKLMQKMGMAPEGKKAYSEKKKQKEIDAIIQDFTLVTNNLERMLQSLDVIISKDQIFFFKAFEEIEKMYWRIGKIEHMPEHLRNSTQQSLYSILATMVSKEYHASQIAKGHAKGFMKFADIAVTRTRKENRLIKRQTIELDHIRDVVEPMQERIDRMSFVNGEELHKLAEDITKIIKLYHLQLDDLKEIIHEADVLVHRTEDMFKEVDKETAALGIPKAREKAEECAKIFHKILEELSTQSGREYRDMHSRFQHIPVPKVEKMAA
jgi:hypothetical protein